MQARAVADRDDEHALSDRIRREETPLDLVVEEREPGRAQAMCVRRQVHLAGDRARLELRRSVAARAKLLERRREVGHEEHRRRGVPAEPLVETKERRLVPEVALAKEAGLAVPPDVRAGLEAVDPVDDEVRLDQARAVRRVIAPDAASGASE